MKQYNLNQVFIDTENFSEPKRLKCVPDEYEKLSCYSCVYDNLDCNILECLPHNRADKIGVHFIETDEPLTEKRQ